MTVTTTLKRVFVGRPIATRDQEHQRLPKKIALATFSSDAISSTAYATEEILFVAALGAGSSLALGHRVLVPIGIVVAVLIASVVSSYRQTIFAYPHGGGSYLVSRDNLGRYPSLVAGASLLVDYVLTVAVSISAGVAAIVSLPALRDLRDHRVLLCLGVVLIITLGNLRGMKESGLIFAVPTYLFILGMSALDRRRDRQALHRRPRHGGRHPLREGREDRRQPRHHPALRAFSSGAVALTGIEAIADGVPAFQPPEAKNAARTLTIMGFVLGTLFLGVSVLGKLVEPVPTHDETVISQMGRVVFGDGAIHVFLQIVTCAILVLAANTAYADFPRLSSIISRDGFLPRQFANRGDRLVFSNGVVFLALAASGLLVAFGGITTG